MLIHDQPNGRVLLGRKKRGIGQGNFNGFGGKIEKDKDTDVVSSALRELKEEAGVAPVGLSRRGVLSFHFLDTPSEVWETHLFSGEGIEGEPEETEEMEPRWFGVHEVPYEQMWQDDRFWLPSILGCDGEGRDISIGKGAAEQRRQNVIGEFWVRRFLYSFSFPFGEPSRSRPRSNKLTLFSFLFLLTSSNVTKNINKKQFESSSGPGSKIMTKHELTVVLEEEGRLPPLPSW